MDIELMEKNALLDIELMEKKLYNACVEGDVETLEALMREDKLILARISLFSCFNQTPLHLACMLGHFEFAKSLLCFKPDFASRLDSQGCSPLHLASANGYANIVELLLQYDGKMCRVGDEDGRTPLHLAVMNGQHECVRELIEFNSDYGQEGAILHLCVMYNRLNILILILESNVQDWSNIKDDTGNTILHFATELRRMQIIKYLLKSRSQVVDVNLVNKNGLTALDIIEQMPKDAKTVEIKELLVSANSIRAKEIEPATATIQMDAVANQNIVGEAAARTNDNSQGVKKWKKPKKGIFRKTLEKSDKSLLVAASVIAAMAYQAAISPPGGVAGMDATQTPVPSVDLEPPYVLEPSSSLLAYFYPELSDGFWIFNTISFIAALSVIFVYVSGASPKSRFFLWLIRLGMSISLTSMTLAYVRAVEAITPSDSFAKELKSPTIAALTLGLLAWVALLCLAILVIVYRFLSYIVRTVFNTIKRAFRKKNTSQDAAATFRRTSNANIV
ncbi:PGG domain-containing protein [Heracleum sosnowskyi]|uniref:PGG domain-containing protein n=1 Tax=Heracleum sosnowskyi TaxID=360622 RepID=A0AAD8GPJ9_9APIA|nr:PGG domain-containing protein [Heracleum sosnowskyi]